MAMASKSRSSGKDVSELLHVRLVSIRWRSAQLFDMLRADSQHQILPVGITVVITTFLSHPMLIFIRPARVRKGALQPASFLILFWQTRCYCASQTECPTLACTPFARTLCKVNTRSHAQYVPPRGLPPARRRR